MRSAALVVVTGHKVVAFVFMVAFFMIALHDSAQCLQEQCSLCDVLKGTLSKASKEVSEQARDSLL
jgi:hypothetical protein